MTECNRCGDCCEHLTIAFTKVQLRAFLVAAEGRPGTARFEDHRADAIGPDGPGIKPEAD